MATLAEELRRARTDARLSPSELARRSKVQRSRIYAIEEGETLTPTPATLQKLARAITSDPARATVLAARFQALAGYVVDAAPEEIGLSEDASPLTPDDREIRLMTASWKRAIDNEPDPERRHRLVNAVELALAIEAQQAERDRKSV